MGDPAGIGAEIIVKALNRKNIYNKATFVIFGDLNCIMDAIKFCKSNLKCNVVTNLKTLKTQYPYINVINSGYFNNRKWEYKKADKICGKASYNYIISAIKYLKTHYIDGVVTAPINKESMKLAGIKEIGHTEIFAKETNTKNYAMLLMSGKLRVIHVTAHVSLSRVPELITKQKIISTIKLANSACKSLGIVFPRIGVCGLNPHCSDNGVMGNEEERIIKPAIKICQESNIDVYGPVSPDSIFAQALSGKYDVVVAMYHDQGHIPIKLLGFKFDKKTNNYKSVCGINMTIGLPFPRVSVDHGTAYGKAGEGRAREDSMIDAINTCVSLCKNSI